MEYKWRLGETGSDMSVSVTLLSASYNCQYERRVQCVDSRDKHVAVWSGDDRQLKVAPRCVAILDRIVVTCFLNLWFKRLGKW